MGLSHHVINHQLAVMRKARDIAHNITKVKVDVELVKIGALMHDIGRVETHGMNHGPQGGKILRDLGYPEELANIAERHSLAGITLEEAIIFNLPEKSYVPVSIEEKIVCLADKFFSGTIQVSIKDRFQKWFEKYGDTKFLRNQIRKAKELEEEILSLIF